MKSAFFKKIFAVVTLVAFLFGNAGTGFAQVASQMPWMPETGKTVPLSAAFVPAHLWGMTIHPEEPFAFDFLIQRGDQKLTDVQKKEEYEKLIKYFLAALAVPDEEQWVNLSPYEKDRIIPDTFGLTVMGRDLLAQDYLLKQISASLTNPDTDLGKQFWNAVYEKAHKEFGTTDIPTDTFHKVWIQPDQATVYEKGNTVFVVENHLKVMLEADYLAASRHPEAAAEGSPVLNGREPNNAGGPSTRSSQGSSLAQDDVFSISSPELSKEILREVIIPELEKEVNEGKNFAPLRQVFSSMLLATWYKRVLKGSILARLYADQGKVKGVDQDPRTNQEIYDQYVEAYRKGVFNMIREDMDRFTDDVIPHKYFSGGMKNAYQEIGDAAPGEAQPVWDRVVPDVDRARTLFAPDDAMSDGATSAASAVLGSGERRVVEEAASALQGLTARMSSLVEETEEWNKLEAQRVAIASQAINDLLAERIVDGTTQGSNALIETMEAVLERDQPGLRDVMLKGELFAEIIVILREMSISTQRSLLQALQEGGITPQSRIQELTEEEHRLAQIMTAQDETGRIVSPLYERWEVPTVNGEDVSAVDSEILEGLVQQGFLEEAEDGQYWLKASSAEIEAWVDNAFPQKKEAIRHVLQETPQDRWIKGRAAADPRFSHLKAAEDGEMVEKSAEEEEADVDSILADARAMEGTLINILDAVVRKAGIARQVRDKSWRVKGLPSSMKKIRKYRAYPVAGRPPVSVASLTDLFGGRLVLEDMLSLEKVMQSVEGMMSDPEFAGMRILRKENYYINGLTGNDPYRAVQYTITMPGEDGVLYSYELQLVTFDAMVAADIAHDAIYKPEILNLPDQFQWAVREYCLQTNIEAAKKYLRAKGLLPSEEAIANVNIPRAELIRMATEARDANAFYDLVLAHVDDNFATREQWEQAYDWVRAFHDQYRAYLQSVLAEDPETALRLARDAHNLGYYYTPSVAGVDGKSGTIFDAGNQALSPVRMREMLAAQPAILTEEGRQSLTDAYEKYDGGGKSHKITVGQLDLESLTEEELTAFFQAMGKNVTSDGISSLIQRIFAKEAAHEVLINLWMEPFDALQARGRKIADLEVRARFLQRIVMNNVDALVPSVYLTEIGGVDAQGVRRDISVPAFEGASQSMREMLVHVDWVFAQQWDGKAAYDPQDPAKQMTTLDYRRFLSSKDPEIMSKAGLDRTVDIAGNTVLVQILLEKIAAEEARALEGEVDRYKLAYLQRLKAQYLDKFIKSVADVEVMAEATAISGYVDAFLQQNARDLIDGNGRGGAVVDQLRSPYSARLEMSEDLPESDPGRAFLKALQPVVDVAGFPEDLLTGIAGIIVDRAQDHQRGDQHPLLIAARGATRSEEVPEYTDAENDKIQAALEETVAVLTRSGMTPEEADRFQEGFMLTAYEAHRGQYRYGGAPYAVHPLKVALFNRTVFHSVRERGDLLAFGHDIWEDQEEFAAQLEEALADDPAFRHGISLLSFNYDPELSFDTLQRRYYSGFNAPLNGEAWDTPEHRREVAHVKLSDILANMGDLREMVEFDDEELRDRGINDTIRYVGKIREYAVPIFALACPYLTTEDKEIFAREMHALMDRYLNEYGWKEDVRLSALAHSMKDTLSELGFPDNSQKTDVVDAAALAKGGIDMNAAGLNMMIRRDGNGMPLPAIEQDMDAIRINGLVPRIMSIEAFAPVAGEMPKF